MGYAGICYRVIVVYREFGMSDGHRRRNQRKRLFEHQNGLCFWCRGPMRLLDLRGQPKVKKFPLDMCTTDHLEPRFNPKRGQFGGFIRMVAACYKCNHGRDREAHKKMDKELLRAASTGTRAAKIAKAHNAVLSAYPHSEVPLVTDYCDMPKHCGDA